MSAELREPSLASPLTAIYRPARDAFLQLHCPGRRRREPVVGTRVLLARPTGRRPHCANAPLCGPRLHALRRIPRTSLP